MLLLLYGFVILSISGLLILTWIHQKKYDNHLYKRIEFMCIVFVFLVNIYLIFLLGYATNDYRDSTADILGSDLMVILNFVSFYISFFYVLYYSASELYEFVRLRVISVVSFSILSANFINIMYQFYFKNTLESYESIGTLIFQFLLVFVTCFSVYQVFWGREYEN